jgi:acetylornithine deacetylase/succinyl-diaminopimelate desuccinylase-like protein
METVNRGKNGGSEREAAEYVQAKLQEVGVDAELYYPPGHVDRTSVVAHIEGEDRSRPSLLIHGHLDVVPVDASAWRVPPFSGEIEKDEFKQDCLWGRGAVDMKDMDAMTLAVIREMARSGVRPPRNLVLAFLADEEDGGQLGAQWLVQQHRDLFADCALAIGEVGGFSQTIEDKRFYFIETAEKGLAWMRVVAQGKAGHGSMATDENPVVALARAIARVGDYRFPIKLTATVRKFLENVSDVLGLELDVKNPEPMIAQLGSIAQLIGASLRSTANPTGLRAGDKVNVIPSVAEGYIDGRFLPGDEQEFERIVDELLGHDVERTWIFHNRALEMDPHHEILGVMAKALLAEDPGAVVVPYLVNAGTDAKSFAEINNMQCFGFCPLRLPAGMDFMSMFHAVDERVPIDALRFGVRVLSTFIANS